MVFGVAHVIISVDHVHMISKKSANKIRFYYMQEPPKEKELE